MSRRRERVLLALVVALAASGIVIVASQSRPARMAADFTIDYSAGLLVREGHLAAPYQQDALAATMGRVAPDSGIDPGLPFNKPLVATLPYALLSLLPLDVAFRFWQLLSAGIMIAALALLQRMVPLGRHAIGGGMIGLLAWVPTWATLTEGQVTPLLLLGTALILAALRFPNVALAAAGGALLALKPQYLPAYLLILGAGRRWTELVAAATAGGAVLLSSLAAGPNGPAAMLHNALLANRAVDVRLNESLAGVFGSLLPAAAGTWLAISLYLVTMGALTWLAWRRSMRPVVFAALAGTMTVLASPHALPHDLLILAAPAWLAVLMYRDGVIGNPVGPLLLIELALLVDLRAVSVPLAPIVIALCLGWLGWTFRRRRELLQQHRPPVALAG